MEKMIYKDENGWVLDLGVAWFKWTLIYGSILYLAILQFTK